MSQPWWGQEANDNLFAPQVRKPVPGEFGKRPRLSPDSASAIANEIRTRRPTYTEEWRDDPQAPDAGGVLVELFAQQAASILRRVNRLPDRAFIEFLRNAGVRPEPARPAEAMVQFTVSPATDDSVFLPQGFQIGAAPATGNGDLVVFETTHSILATAAGIKAVIAVAGASERDLTAPNKNGVTFAPLGEKPEIGNSLEIGLDGTASLSGDISLGIRISAPPGEPPPVSAGGVAPIPLPVAPVLQWTALVGSQFVLMDVLRDETSNLFKSGIIQLRVPAGWTPQERFGQGPHYWFRLRLIHGRFRKPPQLSFVRINMARVKAIQTIRDEVLQPVGGPDSNILRLSSTPVVPKSLRIVVDSTPFDDQSDQDDGIREWKEVEDLTQYGPNDRVFTLDAEKGIVTFGDGRHGLRIPPGFRNVQAERYQVGGGEQGAVDRDKITTLLNSANFVTAATNPLPASGGVNAEDHVDAVFRGPATIRSGQRAVTVADYAVWARFVPGADIRKARAIVGFHPLFPGQEIPGVVGVIVVPPVENEGPPIPDETALTAVGRFLSRERAPAGVEIVAAPPEFRKIRSAISFVPEEDANVGDLIRRMTGELDSYLHPLEGGDDGQGWPFGGTLIFSVLLRRLLALPGVRAIPRLRMILDGVPQKSCANVPLGPTELFWTDGHQIVTVDQEDDR